MIISIAQWKGELSPPRWLLAAREAINAGKGNSRRHIPRVLCASALVLLSSSAMAVSECAVNIIEMFTGAAGEILIVFDNSPPIYVNAPTSATDPAQKNAMAVVLTAIATAKPVTIRYLTDGVSCTSGPSRSDYAGIWITR